MTTRTTRAAIEPGTSTKHPKEVVQEALQTTFVLKGTLKRVQLSKLRFIRMRAGDLTNISPEVLAHLDTAIHILDNDNALKVARLDTSGIRWRGFSVA